MFSNSKKLAQQTAERLLAGHLTLAAWWALRHAGVFDAMLAIEKEKNEGIVPLVYAAKTNMSPEVLASLIDYLATTGLISLKDAQAYLTADAKALLEHEDPVLELIHAYEPILASAEHLLARLKTAGGNGYRKSDAYLDAQSRRYATEVYPAVLSMLVKCRCTHLLDLSCGAGDLLMHLARSNKAIVGVGIGADSAAVRRANRAIATSTLEKRLIAVAANPLEICTETRRTFDRIGISKQLWEEIDGLVATNVFTELAARDPDLLLRTLSAIPRNFPKARILIVEPVASPKFDKNYYAAELTLLQKLSNAAPWSLAKWRDTLRQARLKVLDENALATDGLTLFLCKA